MDERVSITEAARRLAVSKDTIRRRIKRGQLQAEKDNFAGEWRVVLPTGAQAVQPKAPAYRHDADMYAELRAHIGSLMQQVADVQAERDRWRDQAEAERARVDKLVEALAERRPPTSERRPWPGIKAWIKRLWEGEE